MNIGGAAIKLSWSIILGLSTNILKKTRSKNINPNGLYDRKTIFDWFGSDIFRKPLQATNNFFNFFYGAAFSSNIMNYHW
mgnify:FL=1